jgi:hypothetical protein
MTASRVSSRRSSQLGDAFQHDLIPPVAQVFTGEANPEGLADGNELVPESLGLLGGDAIALLQLKAPHPFKHEAPTLITRIGAHIRKVPSIENGGEKSGTRRTGMEMGVRSSGLAVS